MKLQKIIDALINTKTIIFFASLISVIAWGWSFSNNYVLTYNDAASHLNIARRIIDNYTPGLAQIGTVWLPFPHMLMFFFAWNDFLWKTAIAGSIVSMVAYVVSVLYTYKTIYFISNKKLGALAGALVLALNPNMLYLQTTPMTETLLIATFVMSAYYLTLYVKSKQMHHLILTGICVMLSTLIRYDGWFLFVTLSFFIPLWGLIRYGRKRAEGELMIFVIIGGLGIVLWVLWNLAIFGDPLYFITGPYSAQAQQLVLKSVGQLPTAGNWFNASFYYIWAAIDNVGMLTVVSSLIALLAIPFAVKNRTYLIVVIAAISPLIFNIIALYIGQSAMNVPQAPNNPGMFNTRYGIMILPACAMVIGLIASNVRFTVVLAFMIVIIQGILFYQQGLPISLVDGKNGLVNTYYTVEASKWLADNYKGGLILTTLASHDAFVARAQLPMKNYIHEGNLHYWENALNRPSETIKYIALLTFPPDTVYKKIKDNPDFTKNYVKVHNYETFEIYERKW